MSRPERNLLKILSDAQGNEKKSKAAFMSLLGDYVCNSKFGNSYNDTFCELCPLQKHQWGGCSKDLNTDFDYGTCAEEIFKFYLENSNE